MEPTHRKARGFDRTRQGPKVLDQHTLMNTLLRDAYHRTVRGLSSEVVVGRRNGLDHDSVVNVDSIATVPRKVLVRPLGVLLEEQEYDLARAFHEAFGLAD